MSMIDQAERCMSTCTVNPGTTLLGPVLGPGLDEGRLETVRCTLDAGHEGVLHVGYVTPFPGFADQRVQWYG